MQLQIPSDGENSNNVNCNILQALMCNFVMLFVVAIPLSIQTFSLIKWEDDKGDIQNFHLLTRVSEKWRRTGLKLGKTETEMDKIHHDQNGNNQLCWFHLIEKWMTDNDSKSYPVSWQGLNKLLKNSDVADQTLNLLRKAVACSTHRATYSRNERSSVSKIS